MIKITCYNETTVFNTRKQAIDFFKQCYYGSEGSEKERYCNILFDLKYTDKTEITD